METLKRIIGVVLIVIAAIVAIQTVIEPIYHTSTAESPASSAWNYINPLCLISIILGVIFGYIRMNRAGENASVQEFIAANTIFYGFLFVAIIFLRNWFSQLGIGANFTTPGDTRELLWIVFDAIFPLLSVALGVHLLRNNASE